MHIFGYVAIGFLIACMLLDATKALSVGQLADLDGDRCSDVAQV